jgi:ABC-type Fe3+-hydroxamate transport system substrate-binding protein
VIVLQSRDEYDNYTATPEITQETIDKLANTVGFTDTFTVSPPFQNSVKITEYLETTNAAIFEWIKFISVFYNLEAKANEVFDTTERRWQCVSEAASLTVTSDDKPNVFWMTYSDYCGGWYIGECPNYYCEYAEQCSATIITTPINATNFSDICGLNYYTIDEVVEIGKDADYWFYLASDWNMTYGLFKDKLDTMSVVQNKKVYDFQGSGPGAWFETRLAEYFVVLQDFCSVVETVPSSLTVNRTYFRNVMDGSPVGSIGTECTENSRSNSILPKIGAVCDDLNLPGDTNPPTQTPPTPTQPTPVAAPSFDTNPPTQTPPTPTQPTPVAAPSSDSSTIGQTVQFLVAIIAAFVL